MNHLQPAGNLLETDRLTLRLLNEGDAPFILDLLNSPGWLVFIGDRNIRTTADAVGYLQDGPLNSYATHGFGLWLVALKIDGTPIGLCGLLKRDYLEHPDIGFAFLPEFMGRGYAFEVVSATLAYATEKLNIPVVLATVMPTNEKSIRLLEKIGLTRNASILSPVHGKNVLLYTSQKQ